MACSDEWRMVNVVNNLSRAVVGAELGVRNWNWREEDWDESGLNEDQEPISPAKGNSNKSALAAAKRRRPVPNSFSCHFQASPRRKTWSPLGQAHYRPTKSLNMRYFMQDSIFSSFLWKSALNPWWNFSFYLIHGLLAFVAESRFDGWTSYVRQERMMKSILSSLWWRIYNPFDWKEGQLLLRVVCIVGREG